MDEHSVSRLHLTDFCEKLKRREPCFGGGAGDGQVESIGHGHQQTLVRRTVLCVATAG